MVKKSKLLSALDAHKGRNYELERQKKLQKAAERRKRAPAGDSKDTLNDNEEQETKQTDPTSLKQNGTGDREDEKPTPTSQAKEERRTDQEEEQDEHGDEDEEEEDIPLSELSEEDATDVIPHQRLTINNSAAILSSLKRISFLTPQTPFSEHNSLTSTEPIDVPDPNDDLTRELAFYTVCVSAAKSARDQLKKEGIPFSRPTDYFAEMVKSDEHMGRVKKKLFDEAAAKKASAEAKRQRDLKKFGKQVQVAKLQQRQKEKRETLDKINSLKRKRKASDGAPTEESDLFDVTLEDEGKSHSRGGANKGGRNGPGAQSKRQKKDQKFGFGGKKRFAKSGDAMSSGDLSGFSVGKMKGQKKGGAQRPGKSRRATFKRT
ncbi:rRNA processing protein [Blastomyces gilchristii SLH14081]|uniref:rRNA processing protein n=1 Tax=Blastomyces gilchristii (strain SLH14081) TaxID=559298 RepID=A0A179UZE4_BLAGS|nr:rRNA processing protein [Blastomyces gilchristii SLH14081]OAT12487.1 rRNA processing protein [Blastomyces gilchristii SLH14081]